MTTRLVFEVSHSPMHHGPALGCCENHGSQITLAPVPVMEKLG